MSRNKAGMQVGGKTLEMVKATPESTAAMQDRARANAEKANAFSVAKFTSQGVSRPKGLKTKKLARAPIVIWRDVPVGTTVEGYVIRLEESPNKKLDNSPVIRCRSLNPDAGEYFLPLGGGLMSLLGIQRGGKDGSTTFQNAESIVKKLEGKFLGLTLTGFVENTNQKGNPKNVAVFEIELEED